MSETVSAYGLKFQGREFPIDQRTSYHVFADRSPCFDDYLDIQFDMALYQTFNMGYVLRVKGENEWQIFNLYVNLRDDDILFCLNQEGRSVLIALTVDKAEALKVHWFKVGVRFDMRRDEVMLRVHDKEKTCSNVSLSGDFCPEIVFGRSDHIIEVPSMVIDRLVVESKGRTYAFPLIEAEGEVVHDQAGTGYGRVANPVWLINEGYHWRKEISLSSATESGSCYDVAKNTIYYINRDTLYVYNTESQSVSVSPLAEPCPVRLFLANCFIDSAGDRLFVYEVYHESPYGGPTVASLDLRTLRWRVESDRQLDMQLHHHCARYDAQTGRLSIFGGFGNLHYSNKFYQYDTARGMWHVVEIQSGDTICPRYFSTMGYSDYDRSLYVFGGMGNESGHHIVGRRYFHDLYRVDMKEGSVRKLWDLSPCEDNVVPARGMVFFADSTFYVLRYMESVSESSLCLYRFAIADGRCESFGDSIPIWSDRITSNAQLYYNVHQNRFFVTVQESTDDVSSSLTVYSLQSPPVTAAEYVAAVNEGVSPWKYMRIGLLVGLVAIGAVGVLGLYSHRRKRSGQKQQTDVRQDSPKQLEAYPVPDMPLAKGDDVQPVTPVSRSNAVYLFGDFTAFDRAGKNIAYLFSAQIRQLIFLAFYYNNTGGISSLQLGDLLWPDKPKDKVKNSRGVLINHLRKLLKEFDGVELVYEKGCFRFLSDEGFYCDYLRCMELVMSDYTEENRLEFLQIVSRGKFVLFLTDPLFDHFKQDVEYRLEVAVMEYMKSAFEHGEYTVAVGLAKAEFNIDPLNETALSYCLKSYYMLKRENAAIYTYHSFVSEYKKSMGEEFSRSFKDYWN